MRNSRREVAGFTGAIVAHAVILAVLTRAPGPSATHYSEPAPSPSVEVDLAVDTAAVPTRRDEPATSTASSASPRVAVTQGPPGARETLPAPVVPVESASPAPPPFDAPLDVRRPLALSDDALGLGGRNVFIGALPAVPDAHPALEAPPANAAPGIQQSLRDALHEHDHAVGLDIAGPVVAVAEELTRPSSAPLNSRAVFEVTADGDGHVTAVRVIDVSQGRSEWERVATSLGEALKTRTLHVPGGSGGAVMTMEVTSRWQLPSGHDPDMEVSILGVPVKKASKQSKHAQKVEILRPDLTLLNLDVDPTNLAPRPLRVVHARVLRERIL